MTECGINWTRSPAESPDMNPVENVWGLTKRYLRKLYKPRNAQQLARGIRVYWKSMSLEINELRINE